MRVVQVVDIYIYKRPILDNLDVTCYGCMQIMIERKAIVLERNPMIRFRKSIQSRIGLIWWRNGTGYSEGRRHSSKTDYSGKHVKGPLPQAQLTNILNQGSVFHKSIAETSSLALQRYARTMTASISPLLVSGYLWDLYQVGADTIVPALIPTLFGTVSKSLI